MSDYWIMEEDGSIKPATLIEWAQWFEHSKRRVAFDEVDGYEISTVFLGIDHGFGRTAEPLLFETMIFGPPEPVELFGRTREMRTDAGYCYRYATRDQALAGHRGAVVDVTTGAWVEERKRWTKVKHDA